MQSDRRSAEAWYWDAGTLDWVKGTQPGGSGGPSSDVTVLNFPATQAVTGPLTDTQLRAADVKITLDGEIPHVVVDSMPAGGSGLTDAELRATPVPVSGTVTASGPLTNTQLRAADVPVSLSTVPLATGAATSANQTGGNQLTRITDGTTTAFVTPVSSVPVYASNAALTVVSRESVKGGNDSTTAAFERGFGMFGKGTLNNQWTQLPINTALTSGLDIPTFSRVLVQDQESSFGNNSTTLGALNAQATTINYSEGGAGVMVFLKNTGSFSGTITPFIQHIQGTEQATIAFDAATGQIVTTLAVGGIYYIPAARLYQVTLRVSAYTSGSCTSYMAPTTKQITQFTSGHIVNPSGASAVNIQDGGNSITVDGTVAVTSAGLTNLDVALSTRLKAADTLAAVTSITNVVHVDDNTSSLTVDAPVATPVFVRLSDGAAAITTLPVSGPLTDTQIRATPLPVNGTVAITAAALPLPSSAATSTIQTDRTQKSQVTDGTRDGTVKAASTAAVAADTALVVGLSPNSPLPTGTNTIGALTSNQSVNISQFGANAVTTGTGASGVGIPRVTVANDSNVIVTPPTLTKGTQGATGFSTQDLKDAGRTAVIYYATAAAAGTTGTETAITLTKASGTSATSTAVSFAPTSGKRFRIQQLLVSAVGHATGTTQATTFALRINTAGAVITTSTPIVWKGRVQTPATTLAYQQISIPIPDGYEILGDGTLQFGVTANAVYTTNAPTWDVTLIGYEY